MIHSNTSSRTHLMDRMQVLFASGLVLLAAPCSAQDAVDPQADTSLATAIVRYATPMQGVVLAVGAEATPLPTGTTRLQKPATLPEIARAYNRLDERFGGVTAFAPPTMTVIPSHLDPPNIYRNIPARQAFTLLAASLNESQRQALVSEAGIGMNEMMSDLQRGLFRAILPDQGLQVIPLASPGRKVSNADIRNISSQQLDSARLRVGLAMSMTVSTVDHDGRAASPILGGGSDTPLYQAVRVNLQFEQNDVDGVRVHEEQPNRPKKGQLNYEASAFQRAVPLEGIKTVGDLIARIAGATGVEIYADRRFESRTVTLKSDRSMVRARDLLPALAFCLTGAYRRVATDTAGAFVLTDDVEGVGARRERIRELEADSDATRVKFLTEAEDLLQKEATLRSLSLNWFGSPLALAPDQQAAWNKAHQGAASIGSLSLAPDQLTGAQRAALDQFGQALHEAGAANPQFSIGELDLNKPVDLRMQPSIQMLVPGLNGPVDTDLGRWVTTLFQNSPRFLGQPGSGGPASGPKGSLSDLATAITHRAVRAHPRTTDQVDALIERMKALHLNELWLDLDVRPSAPASGADKAAPDLLAWALKKVAGTDIAVYPVLNLFEQSAEAQSPLRDLTILGETSAQAAKRLQRRALLTAGQDSPLSLSSSSARAAFSPFSPAAQSLLSARIRSLVSTAGVGGMVWCGFDLPGYSIPKNSTQMAPYGQLGYTPAVRLAFLRKAHADPLDITPQTEVHALFERANMSLPLFDDYGIDRQVSDEWNAYRMEGLRACLRELHAATVPGDGKAPPALFLRPLHDLSGTTWYGSWDSADTPIPIHRTENEVQADDGSFVGAGAPDQQAKTQSRLALVRLPVASATLDEATIVRQWGEVIQTVARFHPWDGFVLDTGE